MTAQPVTVNLNTLFAGIADLSTTFTNGEAGRALAALPISGLSCDSRSVKPGELFLALRGERHHGLQFYRAVRAAGAAAVAWETSSGNANGHDHNLAARELIDQRTAFDPGDCPLIPVPNLQAKLGPLADRFYANPSRRLALIGVTGTDGKTSTSYFIAQCLQTADAPAAAVPCGLLGTLGYGALGANGFMPLPETQTGLTTPDAITLRRCLAGLLAHKSFGPAVRFAVMEVSSHALSQRRVAGLHYAVAVLTNVTRDHLDYHGDIASYRAAKRRLFTDCRPDRAVLNTDDDVGQTLVEDGAVWSQLIGYGWRRRPPTARYVYGSRLRLLPGGLRLQIQSSWGDGELASGLLGRFNASNLLATLATLLALGVPFDQALAKVSAVVTAPGRMERFGGGAEQPLAVVDYAHTPHALEQALQALREHVSGRLWCVFGCGGDRDAGKRPLMGAAAERWADAGCIIVTNDNPRSEDPNRIVRDILTGLRDPASVSVELDRATAIVTAINNAAPGDGVLIAGKGHEDYQLLGERRVAFSDRAVVQQQLDQAA